MYATGFPVLSGGKFNASSPVGMAKIITAIDELRRENTVVNSIQAKKRKR